MDETVRRGRDKRVGGWMEFFHLLSHRPEFRTPADGARPFDFDFRAPDESRARAFGVWLASQTSYVVEVEHRAPGGEEALVGWRVGGQTPPLDPSPRVFEQWLSFIVGAGMAHGCELEACSGIDLARDMPAADHSVFGLQLGTT
jgi:hypothetical protein